mgnify:CR=1 FL=1
MAIVTSKVTVTTTSQSIVSVDNVSRNVRLHAKHECHVGNSGVTAANGYQLDNDDKLELVLAEGEDLWAIATTGTGTLSVLVSKID